MKRLLSLIMLIASLATAQTHPKVAEFAEQVKIKNYDKALEYLMKGSPLVQKFDKGSPERMQLITQLHQAVEAYGVLTSIDFVLEQKEGKLLRQVYLANFEKNALKMDVIFYAPKGKPFVVEYSLDDNLLQALREIQSLKAIK